MKLIFTKDENNEIDVKLQKGLIIEDFTYPEMIGQLLVDNNFSDTDFGDLTEEEQNKINAMLTKITDIFKEEEKEEVEVE
jgi:hypothetical protein